MSLFSQLFKFTKGTAAPKKTSHTRRIMNLLVLSILIVATSNQINAKIFTKCELVRALHETFPRNKLADFICLIQNESSFNSAVKGRQNKNGSYDYGLFQINDKYWCKVGSPGGDCNIDCNSKELNLPCC